MTFQAVVDTVAARGLLVNNCFQLSSSRWRANVTDGNKCWEFGDGVSPAAALEAALAKVPVHALSTNRGQAVALEEDIFA